MDFKKTVAIHYTEFTPSERKICARILEYPQIVNNSIVVLGDLCETSKSAILRFYQKLGYRGYSEFKYSVEESFKNNDEKKLSNESLLSQISQEYSNSILELGALDYDHQLKELASLIDKYPHVLSIGINNTYFAASQLEYSLYSHNRFIQSVREDIQLTYLINSINQDYLCIIYSVSGSTYTYENFIKEASAKGAKIVLITIDGDSELLPLVDLAFVLPSISLPISSIDSIIQIDNRIMLYYFSEIISYYYGLNTQN